MDNKQKKKILSQYIEIKEELTQINDQYRELRLSLESAKAQRISYTPSSVSSTFDKIGDGLCKLDEHHNKYTQMVTKYVKIEKAIGTLENYTERKVMRLKYIQGYRWESIAVEMNYTWRHVHRIHSRALKNIKINMS